MQGEVMDERKLMIFLQKILENGSNIKSAHALQQLKEILIEQKISDQLIMLVNTTIDSLPEAKEIARSQMMSMENIAIAKQRADARKYREEQMYSYRGCR